MNVKSGPDVSGILELGNVWVFCTADLLSSVAYESAEQKTKHYLTSGFLTPLARTQGKVRNNTFPLRRSDNFVHKCLLGIAPQYHAYFLVMLIFKWKTALRIDCSRNQQLFCSFLKIRVRSKKRDLRQL